MEFNLSSLVSETCAGFVGKSLGMSHLKDVAIAAVQSGERTGFVEFVEACRIWFANYGASVGKCEPCTSFAVMQKKGVRGASTFYVYCGAIKRCLRIADDARAIEALQSLSASNVTKGKGKPAAIADADKPAANDDNAPTIDPIEAALATLEQAHKMGGLDRNTMARLQALVTVPLVERIAA